MTTLHETVEVNRPIEEVFDYVRDVTTTPEWDAAALTAHKTTPGAIAVGTEFEVVCALPVGRLEPYGRYTAKESLNGTDSGVGSKLGK